MRSNGEADPRLEARRLAVRWEGAGTTSPLRKFVAVACECDLDERKLYEDGCLIRASGGTRTLCAQIENNN